MNYCWSFNKKTNPQKIKKSKLFLELKRHEHTYQEREDGEERESGREIMITRIWRGKSEGSELAFDPLKKNHGFLQGLREFLLILGQHLTVGLHELVKGWIFTDAVCICRAH
jgi:hypothetical protein